jgi:tyrosyl-tRNA synthetase
LGIDPTGPDIHFGHTTNLLVLKKIIELGHNVILLIGDFTAQTGDPTDKNATRKILSSEEVKQNCDTYLEQVEKILKPGSFTVKYNSYWLNQLTLNDLRPIIRQFTVQQMIARDMFQKRIKEEKGITIEEFIYPLMQGYDSVAMAVDGEIGGTDQTFNMLIGRDLVSKLLNKEKIVITTKLLEDPKSGQKLMNKSGGQFISLQDEPTQMFGKVMALSDESILPFFNLTTEVSDKKIVEVERRLRENENPKNLKLELASELVRMYYGEEKAKKAFQEFQSVFSKGELPVDMAEFKLDGQSLEIIERRINDT